MSQLIEHRCSVGEGKWQQPPDLGDPRIDIYTCLTCDRPFDEHRQSRLASIKARAARGEGR